MESNNGPWMERSIALAMRAGRLHAASEAFIPFVRVSGQTFYANEKPCIVVAGRKHIVEEIV
ncbi:MAG: hypothetical protein WCY41_02500 [Candidatus Micrarchaeia archaeon]